MKSQTPAQVSYNSGSLTPLLFARTDYKRYRTGVREMRGFIPLRQGGFTRAPGTIFRGFVKDNAPSVLVPFEFARNDSLVLEFTNEAMRVWRYGELVQDGSGVYEISTPYTEDNLGSLRAVQSADVIYLADGTQNIHKLSRYALDNWTIEEHTLSTGPFRIQNLDENVTVSCSGSEGTITLSGVDDPFDAAQVGGLLMIRPTDITDIPLWTGDTDASNGDFFRYDDNLYELTAGENTGYEPPIHLEGTQLYNKSEGTKWRFVSDLIGVVRISAVSDANTATAEVVKTVPLPCVNEPTYRWSEGAWSDKHGYPSSIEMVNQRFAAAATPSEPRTVWFSTIGDYDDHAPSVEADEAFAYSIDGSESQNGILWLRRARKGIYIGTGAEVVRGFSAVAGQAIGPTTFDTDVEATNGTNGAIPITPTGFPIYITSDGTRVEELRYSFEVEGGDPLDLSLPADHLGAAGYDEIVWQASPSGLSWIRRSDGDLVVMLYDAKEEVLGWAEVPMADGFVESLAVSRSDDGKRSVLMMIVRREINGETVRMIEEQAVIYGALPGTPEIKYANHLFASKVFDLAEATDTFDVSHLIGQEVYAWTNEGQFGPIMVDETGIVTLEESVDHAVIGLFDDSHFVETHDVGTSAETGDTRGLGKSLKSGGAVHVHQTAAGKISCVEQNFSEDRMVSEGTNIIPQQVAASLTKAYSGVSPLQVGTGIADEVWFLFEPVGGAPMTVLAHIPAVESEAP